MKVNILHSNLKVYGNEMAFLFPIKYNSKRLKKDYGITVGYFQKINESLYESDVLIISSWYIGRELKWWQDDHERVYEFLKTAKSKVKKLIWFDISDSTGTTQLSVLPYVDSYLKCQILKNKSDYLKKYYANRVFTNYYYEVFGINDDDPGEPHLGFIPDKSDLEKISVGWNTGTANYGCYSTYWGYLDHYINPLELPKYYPSRWTSPSSPRSVEFSCRVGYSYHRKTVSYQRKEIANILKNKISIKKVKRKEYFAEMESSKICISPFGLGEITLRDFEIILSGSLIFKANCDHMETWPKLFVKDQTYIDYNWDLSNFEEQLDNYLQNPNLCIEIAKNCQDIYKNLITTDTGHNQFCERLEKIIEK